MPTPDTNGLPPFADFEMMKAKINEIVAKYNNLLVNLDSLNVVSLTADHIDAGTINADVVTIRSDLAAGAFIQINGSGMVINNGSFDTFTADINGAVTMTSALIQSSTGYPRVVMDPTTEIFGAYASVDKFINIIANDSGDPLLYLENDVSFSRIAMISDVLSIGSFARMTLASVDELRISATDANADIVMTPGSSARVTFPLWSKVLNATTNRTLQDDLDTKATLGASTSSAGSATYVGNFPAGTRLATTSDGSTVSGSVIWQGITTSAHSHVQN